MKIAMVCFNVVRHGTFIRAHRLAVKLAKAGHQLTIIATNSDGHFIDETYVEGVQVVTVPSILRGSLRSGWDPYDTLRRLLWLEHRQFDIVHTFESRPTAIYPGLYLHKHGAKLFTDWCDWFGKGGSVEERPNPVIRAILRPVETYYEEHFRPSANGTTVICSQLHKRALQLNIPSQKLMILPNGLDNPDIILMNQLDARQKLGLKDTGLIIGYVGASFKRDLDLMLTAFNKIIQEIPTARLLHIGRSNYVSNNSDRVITTGSIDDHMLNLYLSACNIFWLPLCDTNANRGRLPIKLSSYLSAGRPIVATAVGDIKTFMQEHPVGLLSKDEPDDLASRVITIFQNQDMAETLGRNARDTAQAPQYSWEQRAKDLENFYIRTN